VWWQGASGASPLLHWEERARVRRYPAALARPTAALIAPESCTAVQTYLTLTLSFQ
jgi:hypothetical protein